MHVNLRYRDKPPTHHDVDEVSIVHDGTTFHLRPRAMDGLYVSTDGRDGIVIVPHANNSLVLRRERR